MSLEHFFFFSYLILFIIGCISNVWLSTIYLNTLVDHYTALCLFEYIACCGRRRTFIYTKLTFIFHWKKKKNTKTSFPQKSHSDKCTTFYWIYFFPIFVRSAESFCCCISFLEWKQEGSRIISENRRKLHSFKNISGMQIIEWTK